MKMTIYKFIKILFGFYLILFGIYSLDKLEISSPIVARSIDSFQRDFPVEAITSFLKIEKFYDRKTLIQNTESFKKFANEIIYLMNFSLILGGMLCILGYKNCFAFIIIGLFLNLIFIYNHYYFANEKMKVNVLKIVALLGGAFQLA